MLNSISNTIKMAIAIMDNYNTKNSHGSNYCLFCNNREINNKINHEDYCVVLIAKTIIEKMSGKTNKRNIL